MKRWLPLCLSLLTIPGYYLIRACEIDFPTAIFTFRIHPDFPRTKFLAGHLGVLQPTYARTYLYIAFRYAKGLGFNSAEREQIRSYWQDRDTGPWDGIQIDWLRLWLNARSHVPGAGPAPASLLSAEAADVQGANRYAMDTYSWQANCNDDAFRTAIQTLQARSARFGIRSPWLHDWLKAQDAVFSHCLEDSKLFPSSPPPAMPAIFRADRAYQIAAAHFYSFNYNAALSEFRQIGSDKASPWRVLAPYLVARTMIRITRSEQPGPTYALEELRSRDAFATAEQQLKQILADPSLAPIHGMSAALLRRVRAQVDPESEVVEVAKALMRRDESRSLREDMWDFRLLMDHFLENGWNQVTAEQIRQRKAALPRAEELIDWIATFQGQNDADRDHAVRRWRQSHSLPWLVAAIAKISVTDPAQTELVQASLQVPPDSPAYMHLAFHRNRLRIESGDFAEAQAELSSLINGHTSDLQRSTTNQFRSLQMRIAPDFLGFLSFALRAPVMVTSEINAQEDPEMWSFPGIDINQMHWDKDSTEILNKRTPLALWTQAALSESVPKNLKQEFTLTAFARATLLQDDEKLTQLAPAVAGMFPKAKDAMQQLVTDDTAEARHFAAIFFLIHYSEIRPYLSSGVDWTTPSSVTMNSYDRSWWCSFDAHRESDWDLNITYITPPPVDPDIAPGRAAFLTQEDIQQAKDEDKKLAACGTAPNYFASEVLRWAKQHPDDTRLPEALHYVVLVNKYGCVDAKSESFARQAYGLLHTRYGQSAWARRTPFWYKSWYSVNP